MAIVLHYFNQPKQNFVNHNKHVGELYFGNIYIYFNILFEKTKKIKIN